MRPSMPPPVLWWRPTATCFRFARASSGHAESTPSRPAERCAGTAIPPSSGSVPMALTSSAAERPMPRSPSAPPAARTTPPLATRCPPRSPARLPPASGAHDLAIGDPLPDALTGLLTASAFSYAEAVAPPMFSQGASIGDSAIHRDAYNFYLQDTWKVSDRLTLNYGLRYEIESRIRETARRTSAPVLGLGTGVAPGSELLINPDPAYKLDPNGWGPRLSLDWRAAANTTVHVGGAITTLLVNLWQDNFLTGSTPFVVYPHLTAAPGEAIRFGMTITPEQLPTVYTIGGAPVFASGDSKQVPGNTIMDVLRYEQDL